MAKEIEPKLKLLSEYLGLKDDVIFHIPAYQRGYSWKKDQCDKLWQDIETYIESGGKDPYFFGTIIVDFSKEPKMTLIDGQQRTTTFILLLKALLIRLIDTLSSIIKTDDTIRLIAGLESSRDNIIKILYKIEDEDIPDYLSDPTSFNEKINIVENNSINELHKDELNKIIKAKTFVEAEDAVYKFFRKQKDNKYTNFFKNFKEFYNKSGELGETRLNEFCKTLLNKCQVIEIKSWQTEQAIVMFNSLNSDGLPLTDADIISAQMYSIGAEEYMAKWSELKILSDQLNQENIIDLDSILAQFMYINRAIDGLDDVTMTGLRKYYTETKADLLSNPIELCDNLLKIANNWNKVKAYPIVKLALKFNENIKFYLTTYLYRYKTEDITEENISELVKCLIRIFTILELVDSGYSSKNFKSFLFSENIKLVKESVNIEEILHDFNNHINTSWTKENLKLDIKEYDGNILVFLNEYLFATKNNKTFNIDGTIHIEHIMPSSGREKESIRVDAGIEKEEFESIVNQLGNKCLLEANINESISNAWFKTKKQSSVSNKRGYKDSKFAIASSLVDYPKDMWDKTDIETTTDEASVRITDFVFDNKIMDEVEVSE